MMTFKEAYDYLSSKGEITEDNNKDREAMSIALEAISRQIPKKPKLHKTPLTQSYRCPICDSEVSSFEFQLEYCDCGQHIDWEEINNETIK